VCDAFALAGTPTIAWIDSWQQQTPRSYALIEQVPCATWLDWLVQHPHDGIEQLTALLAQWWALFMVAREAKFSVQRDNTTLTLHHLDTLTHFHSARRYQRAFRQLLLGMVKMLAQQATLQQSFALSALDKAWLTKQDLTRADVKLIDHRAP
jgi:hypothetical protein